MLRKNLRSCLGSAGKEICDQLVMSDTGTGSAVNKLGVYHPLSSDTSYFFSVIAVSPGFRQQLISTTCHIFHQESRQWPPHEPGQPEFCPSDFDINSLDPQRLQSVSRINDIKEYKSKWGRNIKDGKKKRTTKAILTNLRSVQNRLRGPECYVQSRT